MAETPADVKTFLDSVPLEKGVLLSVGGAGLTWLLVNAKNIYEVLEGIFSFIWATGKAVYRIVSTYEEFQQTKVDIEELKSINTRQDLLSGGR